MNLKSFAYLLTNLGNQLTKIEFFKKVNNKKCAPKMIFFNEKSF